MYLSAELPLLVSELHWAHAISILSVFPARALKTLRCFPRRILVKGKFEYAKDKAMRGHTLLKEYYCLIG